MISFNFLSLFSIIITPFIKDVIILIMIELQFKRKGRRCEMSETNRCLKAKDKILNILEKEEITLNEFNNISKDIAKEYTEKAILKPKEALEINLKLNTERIINMVKNAKSINFDELASEISEK